MAWKAGKPRVVLQSQEDWEGAKLAIEPSVRGAAMKPVHELRDPALFDEGGVSYFLYSVAGEAGIAIGKVHW